MPAGGAVALRQWSGVKTQRKRTLVSGIAWGTRRGDVVAGRRLAVHEQEDLG